MSWNLEAPEIAVFGATGGCANGVLVNALRAGVRVVALMRTPSKLTSKLLAQKNSEETLTTLLTIISGSALDVSSVKSALTANKGPNYLVSHIVTSLGTRPALRWTASNPFSLVTMEQPDICANGAHALITALEEIYATTPTLAQSKPKLTFVSNTGISDGPQDVPFGLQLFYHYVLAVPHEDKRAMEIVFRDSLAGKDGKVAVFSGVVGVRPTLLTGGSNADEGVGHVNIRAGTQTEPARGWFVSRADVEEWIWVNVIADREMRTRWEGENVTLTNQVRWFYCSAYGGCTSRAIFDLEMEWQFAMASVGVRARQLEMR